MVAPTMPRFLQMSQLWAQADIAHARKRLRIQARELGGAQRPVQPLLLVAVLLASDEPDPVAERVRVSVAEAGVIVEAEEAGPWQGGRGDVGCDDPADVDLQCFRLRFRRPMGPGGADAFGLRRNVLAVEGDNPVRKRRLDLLVCAAPFSAPPSLGAPFSLASILRRNSVEPCKFPDKVIDDVDDCAQTLLVIGFP
jgi:hypothetical protein